MKYKPFVTLPLGRQIALLLLAGLLPLLLAALSIFLLLGGPAAQAAENATPLDVRINAAYNLVVDSNVSSPSTYGPSVATVMGEFCNTGGTTLTNVEGYIGDWTGSLAGSTPGSYPSRDSSISSFSTQHPDLANTGIYEFEHVGGRIGKDDATRYIGTLAPGECAVQYWHFTYPQCENNGDGSRDTPPCDSGHSPTWGSSVKPEDDLWLDFDIWGSAEASAGTVTDDETWTMTMRNEISAMANKIEPNPSGRWFNTNSATVAPGDVITSNGVLYTFGNVRHGFDNDGDFVPDYNAWMQPVGDAAFDPSCFRLIRTTGVLTVSRSSGQPDSYIHFKDQLYFTDLPEDNTNVTGLIHYVFQALDGPCTTGLTPYQEVASGFDNEKFNADFGGGIPPVQSSQATVTVTKSSNPKRVAEGATVTYRIPFANTGSTDLGLSTGGSNPLVVSDTVPVGMEFTGASAVLDPAGNTVTFRHSTDGGATYDTGLPASGTPSTAGSEVIIQWWLNEPLSAGSTGNYAEFTATVPSTYIGDGNDPFVENCADLRFGVAAAMKGACATTLVEGSFSIGDFVWRDLDLDRVQDGGTETGIVGVVLNLYWDANGDGALDDGDLQLESTTTAAAGAYSFTGLPTGDYLVVIDEDANIAAGNLPSGFRHTTALVVAIPGLGSTSSSPYVDADFGFGPSLSVEKEILGGNGYEAQEVVYNIAVNNLRPGGGDGINESACRYTRWSDREASQTIGIGDNKEWEDAANVFNPAGPDGEYAFTDYTNAVNQLAGTGFDIVPQTGAITEVLAVFSIYVDGTLVDDAAEAYLYFGGTEIGSFAFSAGQLNGFGPTAGAQGLLTWDVSSLRTWNWSDFSGDLDLELRSVKSGAKDGVGVYFDAMGLQIGADAPCTGGSAEDTLTTVPLTDTYDTNLLDFASADPAASELDTTGGVITWTNVGPIGPGETRIVRVTFLGKEPSPEAPAALNNTARSAGASFGDGTVANDDESVATGLITPTMVISGIIFSDVDGDGWQGVVGYESGTDRFIPGVTLVLYRCEALTEPPNSSAACESISGSPKNSGTWTAVMTTTADNGGLFAFEALKEGYYYVDVVETTVPSPATLTADADEHGTWGCTACSTVDGLWQEPGANIGDLIELTAGASSSGSQGDIVNVNFGYTANPAAFGSVWEDNDGDGIRESGENGISGVTVRLVDCGADNDCAITGDNVTTSKTTDVDGTFDFQSLTEGRNYEVVIDTATLPAGGSWAQTDDPDATLDDTYSFTLQAGEVSGSHEFGYTQSGSSAIGDTAFVDWNGDGTQNAGEEGLGSVDVELYEDSNGNGAIDPEMDALVATSSTDNAGSYLFSGLPAGDYNVRVDEEDVPADFQQTADPDRAGVCSSCNAIGNSMVDGTNSDLTVDYGYQPLGVASLGDRVWYDADGDGRQDAGESGLGNITAILYEDGNSNGSYEAGVDALVGSASTSDGTDGNSLGFYLFEKLTVGDYLVDVDTADADLPSDNLGSPYQLTTAAAPRSVSLAVGQSYLDADFGFAPGAVIGDFIWQDNDGDGSQGINEPGLSGIDILLYVDTDGDGVRDLGEPIFDNDGNGVPDATGDVVTTDANGRYQFAGLPAGDYVVVVADSGGVLSNHTLTYDPDAYDAAGTGEISCPEMTTAVSCDGESPATGTDLGQVDRTHDFGYRPLGTIGDTVWLDADGDDERDPAESGIGNVTVDLYECSGPCSFVISTTTNSDGHYGFGALPDGTFEVRVDATDNDFPSGLAIQTYDPDGTLDHRTEVVISGGEVNSVGGVGCSDCALDADFGYRYDGPNSVSGDLFFDADDDGVQDADETTVYPGVTVYLVYCGDDAACGTGADDGQIAITTTDGSGNYSFPALPDGRYVVAYNENAVNLTGTEPTPTVSPVTYAEVDLDSPGASSSPVEETDVDFGVLSQADFGDLPDSYDTTLSASGPRHIIPTSGAVYLGTLQDTDANGLPSADATGDDLQDSSDEDGVNPTPNVDWSLGTGSVDVVTTNCGSTCYLSAWADWNSDGSFGSGERIFTDEPVNGTNTITFDVPNPGRDWTTTKMRFRLFAESTNGFVSHAGLATNGEVEDYQFSETQTTPVTLAYFRAQTQEGVNVFEWSTATELGNAGFNLYMEDEGGRQRLNEKLIPSAVIDSVGPQHYRFVAPIGGVRFYLEDISIWGERTMHGPFQTGRSYGSRPLADPIDWADIRAEQEQARAAAAIIGLGPLGTPEDRLFAGRDGFLPPSNQTEIEEIVRKRVEAVNLNVREDGIHRVTIAELRDAGLNLIGVPVGRLSLWNQGEPVAFHPSDRGRFSPGDYIEFIGEAMDTLYTDANIYTVRIGAGPATIVPWDLRRVRPQASAAPYYMETKTVDDNVLYSASAPHEDPWSADLLRAYQQPRNFDYTFALEDYVPLAPSEMSLRVWGASSWPEVDDDHHFLVSVNELPVSDERFDGVASHTLETALPTAALRSGQNKITIRVAGDTGGEFDQIMLDRYAVTYPRAFVAREGRLVFRAAGDAFEIDNLPGADVVVFRLTEDGGAELVRAVLVRKEGDSYSARFAGSAELATYYVAAANSVHNPAVEAAPAPAAITEDNAQYLMISHPSFVEGLQRLVAFHEARDLQVRVVSVDDIYAEFSHGIIDPQAIKAYISYAYANMGTEYVLLVGGDSYDYRDYLGRGSLSFIPSLYVETTNGRVRFAPADPLYADVDGDGVPEMAIGRFPVRTQTELSLMIEKTLAYARRTATNSAVFAADRGFTVDSHNFVSELPDGWEVTEAYLGLSGHDRARQALLQALNEGPALASYVGHSGASVWSFDGLLTLQDAADLTNYDRPTIVTQWGCWNTYYVSPDNNTLANALLFSGDQGAAAVMGATTLTLASSERELGMRLVPRLAGGRLPMGQAIQEAKGELAGIDPDLSDVLLGWTLLGDPALTIGR